MIKIQEGFYDLVVKCAGYCGDSHIVDRKKTTDKDIWDSAVFVVLLRLGGRLDEAQSNYLLDVIEKDEKLLNKEYLLNTSFGEWSKRSLNIIEIQKKIETNPTKLSALGIIRESTSKESPIRHLHNTLYNFLDYIMQKKLIKSISIISILLNLEI